MNGITILSTGRYIPEDCIANEDFTKFVETSDEWIRTRTGIATRHFANGEPTWYMGAMAAKAALERESIAPEQIDLLLVSCCTPDYLTPSVACMIQRELGLKKAHCIDINCACSGFVYGLDMARRYLNCGDGEIQTVLLVSTERLSQMLDFTDRSTCVLLGDGAGAVVVKRRENTIYAFSGGAMDGREVYRFSTRVFPELLRSCCGKLGLQVSDLDHIIPHQANYRIVDTAMKALGLDEEEKKKVFLNLDKYGNTGSASISIALDEMNSQGLLKRGDRMAVAGFGGGLTYAGIVFEW